MQNNIRIQVTPPPFGFVVSSEDGTIITSPFRKEYLGKTLEEVTHILLFKGYKVEIVDNFNEVTTRMPQPKSKPTTNPPPTGKVYNSATPKPTEKTAKEPEF
jgi:hypothetical protein